MQLKFSSNTITGNLGGKSIHCVVRMSQGTGSPMPGEYTVRPPTSDPLFGRTALVIPSKFANDIGPRVLSAKLMGPASSPVNTPGARVSWDWIKMPSGAPQAGVQMLVLSDKPIAGRNCLIVSQGFADLLQGLDASGGATLTVP
jgi:hypothetical protein